MLDKNEISAILEAKTPKGNTFSFKIALKVLKKIRHLRKMVIRGEGFPRLYDKGENISLWLVENFPKLEQTVRNDVRTLIRLGRLKGAGNGMPMFYELFRGLLRNDGILCEEYIDMLFCVCNGYGEGLDIKNSISLVYLLRLCVCEKICICFEKAYEGGTFCGDILSEIEKLFVTLDILLSFDEERVLSTNCIEMELANDPARLYPRLTPETKALYRNNISLLSKRKKISQKDLAGQIVNECRNGKGKEKHIGKYLCDKPRGGRMYLFLLVFLTCVFTLLLCLVSPLFIFGIIPVYGCTKLILDKFHTRFFLQRFRLCEINLDRIPKGYGVMVVVTTLLSGDKREDEIFSNLERMYHSNGGENVYFGLLCDFCDSHAQKEERDTEIIGRAAERILSLRKQYGDRFFFFVREREYNASEEKYIAPERKRGAVTSLTEFLCGKSDRFSHESIKPDEKICDNIKYVLTLDADTNLPFGSIRRMAGIMMHPCNIPEIDEKNAVVTKGYGILQPAVNPTVNSSLCTFFSGIMCGHGGTDGYGTARIDAAMSLFGRSIFCGKGMFDKECFLKVLCGKNEFSENSILSHDAPEGARLRCAYVPDITLTDSFPSEELSYYKRQHRWIRGDIQNIRFLKGYVTTGSGNRIKNCIGLFAKYFIWHNVYSALLPVFSVLLLCLSLVARDSVNVLLVSVSLSVYVLPFVYSVFSLAKRRIWQNMRRVFYSDGVYTGIWTEFMRMLFRICAMPKSAEVSLDAIFRSVYRLTISKKKLLEWTTSAQNDAEKKDGLLGYVRKNLISPILGTAFFVISDNGFVKLIGLLWLFLPVFAYFSGKKKQKKKTPLTNSQRNTLVMYAEDMWKFFSENVTALTNHLPTDNICVYPERRMARMTSPTNIGLYLVSAVCARKLGFIDSKELDERLYNTLVSLDGLETFDGMLYNWYDVFTAKPMMPKYLSSVDIGNYAACLMCVGGALEEYKDEMPRFLEISHLISKLFDRCNPAALYDKKRNLFYIGAEDIDGKLVYDRNRYDMLMSEARILSFVSVAKGWVVPRHYSSLARNFTGLGGYMGLLSWSGTAFEFFMPKLFIPSKEGSLVYEAEKFAYGRMRRNGVHTKRGYVFGISESCYNELDSAANYKYFAFGVPEIAVRVYKKQNVFSAYSSFLCLDMSVKEVLSNLETMKELGAYGEYGFYESIDFERCSKNEDYSIVRCFMAHHLGMSIASCTNALFDNAVTKWFLFDKNAESAIDLNDESIPYDAYVKKVPRVYYKVRENNFEATAKRKFVPCTVARLNLDNLGIYAKRDRLEIKNADEILAARKKSFSNSLSSFNVHVDIGDERFFFDRRCSLSCDGGRIRFHKNVTLNSDDKFEISLFVTAEKNTCDIARFKISVRRFSGNRDRKITCSISFYPLLDTKENSLVCSFFDSDDVVTSTSDDGKYGYFRRNSRGLCMFAGAVKGNCCRTEVENDKISMDAVMQKTEKEYEAEFTVSFSNSKKCAEMGVVRCRENSFERAGEILASKCEKREIYLNKTGRKGRIKDVMGYSMVKERGEKNFPLDSGEAPYILLSGTDLSALVSKNSLGTSFHKDINLGRITAFSGTGDCPLDGERLVFEGSDGFDLCKNAVNVRRLPYAVEYEGEYRGYGYSVTVFVLPCYPCKQIVVKTTCPDMVRFELLPDRNVDGRRYVGSGCAFFEKRDNTGHEKGFVFGFLRLGTGKELGAEYSIETKIFSFFANGNTEINEGCEYVFCTGFATEEKACEIFATTRRNKIDPLSEAQRFCERISFDIDSVPADIREVLSEYFVFPKDFVCYRSFVRTEPALSVFDALLLAYCDTALAYEKLNQIKKGELSDYLSCLVYCLAVCEYIRISKDYAFAETDVCGETLYRYCLTLLLREKTEREYNSLCRLCLVHFARLCAKFSDVRTEAILREKSDSPDGTSKGGVFL